MLGADFIGPDGFDRFHWYRAERPEGWPEWFYWTPRQTRHVGSDVDLTTVDPLLRDLVLMVHANGGSTTPSCQGHFYDPVQTEADYVALTEDAKKLRRGELRLHEVETGQTVQPHLPDWKAPDRDQLHRAAKRYSGFGRIGVLLPSGERLNYTVRARTSEELEQKWSEVTRAVAQELRRLRSADS
jgi:hypothetical protein